jgi:DNA polymerase III alpha subunit
MAEFCDKTEGSGVNSATVVALAEIGALNIFYEEKKTVEEIKEDYLRLRKAIKKRNKKSKPEDPRYEVVELF